MTEICKGCGEELTSINERALSRYEHGDICPNCGVREAMQGDFITEKLNNNLPDDGLSI